MKRLMNPETAQKLALHLCMQGAGRYLECLHAVVKQNAKILPAAFVSEVRRDFNVYAEKMTEAGLPFKDVTLTEDSNG